MVILTLMPIFTTIFGKSLRCAIITCSSSKPAGPVPTGFFVLAGMPERGVNAPDPYGGCRPGQQAELKAGEIVMTGSFTRQFPIAPGDKIETTFPGLGVVATSMSAAAAADPGMLTGSRG
jgi:hypothetical protein